MHLSVYIPDDLWQRYRRHVESTLAERGIDLHGSSSMLVTYAVANHLIMLLSGVDGTEDDTRAAWSALSKIARRPGVSDGARNSAEGADGGR